MEGDVQSKDEDETSLCCSFNTPKVPCGFNSYLKNAPNSIIPLSLCKKSIAGHLRFLHINQRDVTSEGQLIQLRGGLFDAPIETLTVCPNHRVMLGLNWRCSQFCSFEYCGLERKRRRKALTTCSVTSTFSKFLWKTENRLVPVGSGICSSCRSQLAEKMKQGIKPPEKLPKSSLISACSSTSLVTDENSNHLEIQAFKSFHSQGSSSTLPNPNSIPSSTWELQQDVDNLDTVTNDNTFSQSTIVSSEWLPDSQSSRYSAYSDWLPDSPGERKRKALNEFLTTSGVSPVKKCLNVKWEEASERTKSDYRKKATQIMQMMLAVLAPNQEQQLMDELKVTKSPESNKDSILQSVASTYLSVADWGTQRQMLSIIVKGYSFSAIKEYIPSLSRYKYTAAKKHAEIIGTGMPLPEEKNFRERATEMQIEHFLSFITSPAVMTDMPYGDRTYKLSSGETLSAPRIILNTVRTRTVQLYLNFCKETVFSHVLSERSYMRMLESIQPAIRKCMKGLDNFAAERGKAFDDLKRMVDIIGENGKGKTWSEKVQTSLNGGKQYMKVQYKVSFALSSKEDCFANTCSHDHNLACEECDVITDAMKEIEDAAMNVTYENQDESDEVCYTVAQSVKAISKWKSHILRSVNQDRARKNVLEELQQDEVLLERDWAMKFLPMQYRESQSKWFAKRGLSWHVSVATMKVEEGTISNITYVHVLNSASQDAQTSSAILYHTVKEVSSYNCNVTKVYLRSDNAGCFHSSYSVNSIPVFNQDSNIKIQRMDFSDPQGGKGICDRKAAHIKAHIRRYVNEGNNVVTADDFRDAVEKTSKNVKVFVCVPPLACKTKTKEEKIGDISLLNNFVFCDEHTQSGRQFEIGYGKKIKTSNLLRDAQEIPHLQILSSSTLEESLPQLLHTSRSTRPEETTGEVNNSEDNEIESSMSNMFSCPEEGCTMTFVKHGNLINHLDVGIHRYPKESKNIKDRTRLAYSTAMESKECSISHERSNTSAQGHDQSELKMGWALKSKREVKRFSVEQKQFLTEKFSEGEITGHKCDPEEACFKGDEDCQKGKWRETLLC